MISLVDMLKADFDTLINDVAIQHDEVTVELPAQQLRQVCLQLRDDERYAFHTLIDICGVDYLHYGLSEWRTDDSTRYGFDRAAHPLSELESNCCADKRFAVVYHLLSVKHNRRLRLRIFAEGEPPMVDSVQDIFASADWFERETFDLFGILFNGHSDLRRILTDYGFIGHPFRKDFPVSGHVEVRYDKQQQRVVYEPVDITPRVLVPKIIRDDSRYTTEAASSDDKE